VISPKGLQAWDFSPINVLRNIATDGTERSKKWGILDGSPHLLSFIAENYVEDADDLLAAEFAIIGQLGVAVVFYFHFYKMRNTKDNASAFL
jgi:hypothetical protein